MHGGFKPLVNPATPRQSEEELESTREEREIARAILRRRGDGVAAN